MTINVDPAPVQQAVVTAQAALNDDTEVVGLALFNADGTPYTFAATGTDFAALAARVAAVEGKETDPAVTTATAIGTAAKTTAAAVPVANTFVAVKFTNGNSANSPTVTFATGGAIPILLGGVASTGAKMTVAANGVVVFFYDGTSLHQLGTVA